SRYKLSSCHRRTRRLRARQSEKSRVPSAARETCLRAMNRAWLRILLVVLAIASPRRAPAATSQEAFDAARNLYEDGKWTDALAAFQKFEREHKFSTALPQAIYF